MKLIEKEIERRGGFEQMKKGDYEQGNEAIGTFYYLYLQAKQMDADQEFINLMNSFLGGIVKASPGENKIDNLLKGFTGPAVV
jgi:hypothetical protein